MKRPLKQTFFLFFSIILTIIVIDCVLVEKVSYCDQIASSRDCSELPNHCDDSHLNHFDDVYGSDSEILQDKLQNQPVLVSILSVDINSNYLTCIWQPPKRA